MGYDAEFDIHSRLYRRALVPQRSGDGGSVLEAVPDEVTDATADAVADAAVERRPLRLYTDMCADLFHSGHVNYLRQCVEVADNVHLIVGIHSDETIESYKRAPVCTMEERVAVVAACKYVGEVLPSAPLRVTAEFMQEHGIDFVVHGLKRRSSSGARCMTARSRKGDTRKCREPPASAQRPSSIASPRASPLTSRSMPYRVSAPQRSS